MIASGAMAMPLHFGKVPNFLTQKMGDMGEVIAESIIENYGTEELLSRMSSPNWFQAFGATMGMHWNSSGVTAVVMGALQRRLNKRASDLGIYILGGKGKRGYAIPGHINRIAQRHDLDNIALAKQTRLCARIDNNAIQDGYNLYQQYFVLDRQGKWTAITQGMNKDTRRARRYHWHCDDVKSFVAPHSGIVGVEQQQILNLVDKDAAQLQQNIVKLTSTKPTEVIEAYQEANLPDRHDVRKDDVNLARLGSVLDLAYNRDIEQFEDLVDLHSVGPKTLKALAMASEVIHGDATRFEDPARFSFAVGGKDGRPHPIDTKAMQETVNMLEDSVSKSKMGDKDKSSAIKRLHKVAVKGESKGTPIDFINELIDNEWNDAENNGGHTFMGEVIKGVTRSIMDTQNGLLYGKK